MSIFSRNRQEKKEKDHREVVRASQSLYQIQEYGGELWLTYNGNLVCPCSMLVDDPVKSVETMRKMYVERTPKLPRMV